LTKRSQKPVVTEHKTGKGCVLQSIRYTKSNLINSIGHFDLTY